MLYQVIEDGKITQSYAMPDHDDTHHIGSAKRNTADGVAGLNTSSKILKYQLDLINIEAVDTQYNPATGTCEDPQNINMGTTINGAMFDVIGEYAEIIFPAKGYITRFRHYGEDLNNDDGVFKIQHYYRDGWVDNTIGISTRASSWSGWTDLTTPIWTTAIRVVATTIDTGAFDSVIRAIEFKW